VAISPLNITVPNCSLATVIATVADARPPARSRRSWVWQTGHGNGPDHRPRCSKAAPVKNDISVVHAVRQWRIHPRVGPMKSTSTRPCSTIPTRSNRTNITTGRNACTGLHQLTNCPNTRAPLHSWVAKKMAVLRTLPQVPRRRDTKTLIPLKTHASTILFPVNVAHSTETSQGKSEGKKPSTAAGRCEAV